MKNRARIIGLTAALLALIVPLGTWTPAAASGGVTITRLFVTGQPGSLDSWLNRGLPDNNYLPDAGMRVMADGGGLESRAIVRFDLSSLPGGATVSSATLSLEATAVDDGLISRNIAAYRVTTDWDGTVTWNKAKDPGSPWAAEGGDLAAAPSDTKAVTGIGTYSWTVTSDVSSFLSAVPASNFGWILKDDGGDAGLSGKLFASAENGVASFIPKLTVTYTAPLDSYEDAGRTVGREKFGGPAYGTVYVKGSGFAAGSYSVAYYDSTDTNKATDSPVTVAGDGILLSSYLLTGGEAQGTGHILVQPIAGYTAFGLSSYAVIRDDPDTYGLLGNDAFEIDTVAPAKPGTPDLDAASDNGSSSVDNITNDNTPAFSGTAEALSMVKLYAGAMLVGTSAADAGGNWTITSVALPDAAYSMRVTATDTAGNTSVASDVLSVTIDTVPPAPGTPDLNGSSDSGSSSVDNITNDSTPTFSGTAEALSTVKLYAWAVLMGTGAADGGGNWTITSDALADAGYPMTVTVTDVAGNTFGASGILVVFIDTVAPVKPGTPDLDAASDSGFFNVDNLTNDNTPTFSGGAEPLSTMKLYAGAVLKGTGAADAFANWTITSDALADAVYPMTVTSTDAAGNTSIASDASFVMIDTVAPVKPGTPDLDPASDSGFSAVDNITNDSTPTFGGMADPLSTVNLYAGAVLAGTSAGGNWTMTVAALPDAVYGMTVTATDAAGNTSAASDALNVTIDTVAPAKPAAPDLDAASDNGSSSADNITNDNTPTFNGTAEPLSTVQFYSGAILAGMASADAGGNWTVTTGAPADAVYSMTVTATDSAGNTSVASDTLSLTIDTVTAKPSTPDLDAASDSGVSSVDNVTNDSTPAFSGMAEPLSTVKLYAGAVLKGTATADAGGNWTITSAALADAPCAMTAMATDTAGNTSAASDAIVFLVDTVAPVKPGTPDLDPASDSGFFNVDNITTDTTPAFSGTAEAFSTVKLYAGAVLAGTSAANVFGNWSMTIGVLPDAVFSMTVTAIDAAGNTSMTSDALSLTIDTIAPAKPGTPDLDAASDNGFSSVDNITNDNTPTFGGAAEALSWVQLYAGAMPPGMAAADASGNWTITSAALADAVFPVTVMAIDAAGNTSTASDALIVSIDTVPPVKPSTPDLDAASDSGFLDVDNITSDSTPVFSGMAEPLSTVKLYAGAVLKGTSAADAFANWTITSDALADAVYSVTVTSTDTAGNTSVASDALSVTVDTVAPVKPGTPDLDAASDSGFSSVDNITNDTTPTFNGSAEALSTVKLYAGVVLMDTAAAGAGGNWTITSAALTDAVYGMTVTATDAAGNTSVASNALSVTIDTAPPTLTVTTGRISISGATGVGGAFRVGNVARISWDNSATGDNNPDVHSVSVDFSQFGGGWTGATNAANVWTANFSVSASGIDKDFTVSATDVAGNVESATAPSHVHVDGSWVVPPVPLVAGYNAFNTIQSATNSPAIPIGVIVLVNPGTYTENITINKSMVVKSTDGAAATVVQAAAPGSPVFILSGDKDVTLDDLTIQGATGSYGVLVQDGASARQIKNCVITGNGRGVQIAGAVGTGSRLRYNIISGNTAYGVFKAASLAVDAKFNLWGDSLGPKHATNPLALPGAGDTVSDDVDFQPWLRDSTNLVTLGDAAGTTYFDAARALTDTVVIFTKTATPPLANAPRLAVAKYSQDPGTPPSFLMVGGFFFDVFLDDPDELVTSVEIRHDYVDPDDVAKLNEKSLVMKWWDGSNWTTCTSTGVNTQENYVWAIITPGTTPSVLQLNGTPFTVSGERVVVPATNWWGSAAMALLFLAAIAWVTRRGRGARKAGKLQ